MSKKVGDATDILRAVKTWVESRGGGGGGGGSIPDVVEITYGEATAGSNYGTMGKGVVRYSNGMMIQWDRISVPANTTNNYPFPYVGGNYDWIAIPQAMGAFHARASWALYACPDGDLGLYRAGNNSSSAYVLEVTFVGLWKQPESGGLFGSPRFIVDASPMPTDIDDNYSWYRLWSDGWLEQGGVKKATANAQTHTITFPKPYLYNNYSVSVAFEYANASSAEYKYICPKNLTTTGFQVVGYVTNTQYTSWHTEGWAEVGGSVGPGSESADGYFNEIRANKVWGAVFN